VPGDEKCIGTLDLLGRRLRDDNRALVFSIRSMDGRDERSGHIPYHVTATSDLGRIPFSLKRERPPSLERIPSLGKCMPEASIDMFHVTQGLNDRPGMNAPLQ